MELHTLAVDIIEYTLREHTFTIGELHARAIDIIVYTLKEHEETIMDNLAYHARYLVRACKILYSIGPSHDESSLERPVFLDPLVSMVKRVCAFIHQTSYEKFTKRIGRINFR